MEALIFAAQLVREGSKDKCRAGMLRTRPSAPTPPCGRPATGSGGQVVMMVGTRDVDNDHKTNRAYSADGGPDRSGTSKIGW